MALPALYHGSPRGQCAVMLLAALRDLYVNDGLRSVTKREAISCISQKHWFAIQDDDREPYPSQLLRTKEPRWYTLIAWARKDSVLADLVSYEARDAWGLTRKGRDVIDRFHDLSKTGKRPVAPCFLWSSDFKKFMLPEYVPGDADMTRPKFFYRDTFAKILEEIDF